VAKGAYEAGVLDVIASRDDIQVTRIVAASAGALNAAYFAYAIRNGTERDGARTLIELWRNHASFSDVFSWQLSTTVDGTGLSSTEKLRELLRSRITSGRISGARPISLRILVSPLDGIDPGANNALANIDDPADAKQERIARTTHEHVCDFDAHDFDSDATTNVLINAAVASSSFPGAFVPVEVPGVGRCIDGGTVNNTPVKWALGGPIGDELDAIFVVAPTVEYNLTSTRDLRGIGLMDHVLTMLIDERLYRDLRETDQVNEQLAALEREITDPDTLKRVKKALGWQTMRQIKVISIRPSEPLEGNAFSGFRHAGYRDQYIDVGRETAKRALASWP